MSRTEHLYSQPGKKTPAADNQSRKFAEDSGGPRMRHA